MTAAQARTDQFAGSSICAALMLVVAVTFWIASAIHFGAHIPVGFTTLSDSFPGAAAPEAIVGVVVAAGAVGILASLSKSWEIGVGTTAFGILVTIYGLSVTLGSGRSADVTYHIAVLAAMLVVLALLLTARGSRRRAL